MALKLYFYVKVNDMAAINKKRQNIRRFLYQLEYFSVIF